MQREADRFEEVLKAVKQLFGKQATIREEPNGPLPTRIAVTRRQKGKPVTIRFTVLDGRPCREHEVRQKSGAHQRLLPSRKPPGVQILQCSGGWNPEIFLAIPVEDRIEYLQLDTRNEPGRSMARTFKRVIAEEEDAQRRVVSEFIAAQQESWKEAARN